jgi:hypothetical protein
MRARSRAAIGVVPKTAVAVGDHADEPLGLREGQGALRGRPGSRRSFGATILSAGLAGRSPASTAAAKSRRGAVSFVPIVNIV